MRLGGEENRLRVFRGRLEGRTDLALLSLPLTMEGRSREGAVGYYYRPQVVLAGCLSRESKYLIRRGQAVAVPLNASLTTNAFISKVWGIWGILRPKE